MTDLAQLGQPADDIEGPAPGDIELTSVTRIISILHKEGLLFWTGEEAAKAAIYQQATWRGMIADGDEEAAIKWIRDARFRRPVGQLSAANLGTVVHDACEAYALTGTRPSDADIGGWVGRKAPKMSGADRAKEVAVVNQCLDQFDGWLQQFTPSYQATEVVVYNPARGYAGQADAFLTIDGVRTICDYKSSRRSFDNQGRPTSAFPEVSLQLAAYRHATTAAVWRPRRYEKFRRRTYLLSPAEQAMAVPVPEVDGGLVIHITPGHCVASPVQCDETVFKSFLFITEAARWQFELSKTAIGQPLERA